MSWKNPNREPPARKTKLVLAMQVLLKEYLANPARDGDAKELQAELAYVLRLPVPSKKEAERIRTRWKLGDELADAPIVDQSPRLVEPIPLKVGATIPVLPPTRPASVERARWVYARFCVHCDRELEYRARGGWQCACWEARRTA